MHCQRHWSAPVLMRPLTHAYARTRAHTHDRRDQVDADIQPLLPKPAQQPGNSPPPPAPLGQACSPLFCQAQSRVRGLGPANPNPQPLNRAFVKLHRCMAGLSCALSCVSRGVCPLCVCGHVTVSAMSQCLHSVCRCCFPSLALTEGVETQGCCMGNKKSCTCGAPFFS
jgi:hypothetical protein